MKVWWMKMLVEGTKVKDIEDNDIEMAGGAVYAKAPAGGSDNKPTLMLSTVNPKARMGTVKAMGEMVSLCPVMQNHDGAIQVDMGVSDMGWMGVGTLRQKWGSYFSDVEYYAAIVEKRY